MKPKFTSGLRRTRFIWAAFLLLTFSCEKSRIISQTEEIEKPEVVTAEDVLFDIPTILKLKREADQSHKKESEALNKQAGILIRSPKKIAEGIEVCTKSILSFPTPEAYFQLGNFYLVSKEYSKAEKAYTTAELLNYYKLSLLYFKLSKLYSFQNNLEQANKYLKLAVEKGFSDVNSITRDIAFKNLRKTEAYRTLIADLLSNDGSRKEALFEMFAAKFPLKTLPFRIERSEVEEFNYENFIPYDFEDLLTKKIRKRENKEYSFVAKVDSTNKYTAVIYSSIDAVENEYGPAIENYLVVYNKRGEVIDDLLFSCTCSPTLTYTGVIDGNKEIRVTEYENIWKYDPSSTDYIDNQLDNTVSRFIYHYKLTKEGKIKFEKKVETGIVARI